VYHYQIGVVIVEGEGAVLGVNLWRLVVINGDFVASQLCESDALFPNYFGEELFPFLRALSLTSVNGILKRHGRPIKELQCPTRARMLAFSVLVLNFIVTRACAVSTVATGETWNEIFDGNLGENFHKFFYAGKMSSNFYITACNYYGFLRGYIKICPYQTVLSGMT